MIPQVGDRVTLPRSRFHVGTVFAVDETRPGTPEYLGVPGRLEVVLVAPSGAEVVAAADECEPA